MSRAYTLEEIDTLRAFVRYRRRGNRAGMSGRVGDGPFVRMAENVSVEEEVRTLMAGSVSVADLDFCCFPEPGLRLCGKRRVEHPTSYFVERGKQDAHGYVSFSTVSAVGKESA